MKNHTQIPTLMLTVATLSMGTAFAQTYVSPQARQQANDQLRYDNELSFYQRGYQNAMQQYELCMQRQRNSGAQNARACDTYRNQATYYSNMISSMRRPVAAYPGQGMFPSAGQVAQGVANGLMNGQTQFPTDPNQTLQQPPVDYQNAMGGYSNQAAQANQAIRNGLPTSGFQQYTNGNGGYQTIRVPVPQRQPTPVYRQPVQQRPVQQVQQPVRQPVQQRPTPVLTYPPYNGYPDANPPRY